VYKLPLFDVILLRDLSMLWKTIPYKWDALRTYSFPMYITQKNVLKIFRWHLKTHEMIGDIAPSQE